jgi:putative transposase
MPWRNMSTEEERLEFIHKAISHKTITFEKLCIEHNISTKTGYKWLNRFYENGEEGLKELTRAHKSYPSKITDEVKSCILELKEKWLTWGPKKIRAEFIEIYSNLPVPSERSISNIFYEFNLVRPRHLRRHVARTEPLKECKAPNHTWQYDFKGWFKTEDGSKCEPLTITDGFSRYLIECRHLDRKRSIDVWKVLESCFHEYGLPERMRSDNGPPFASLSVGRLSNLSIKLIKAGVTPEWIEPGCPQQNGRHERFHQTLKNETAKPPAKTLSLQQEKFKQFKNYYNFQRPHEALQQKKPASIYITSPRIWDGRLRSPEYSNEYEIRKVGKSGNIHWRNSAFFLSEALAYEYVGIKELELNVMGVYYGPICLGKIDLNKGFKRL